MKSSRPMWSKTVSRFRAQFPGFYEKLPALVELTRLNRPVGIYLLLWPTITALWIASEGFPSLSLFLIFMLGTAVMRSAGCCVNDFADHKIDGKVLRTEQRPLPTGSLSRRDAFMCFAVLSAVGFLLVLLTNRETVLLSFGAIALIAIYPFMKRYTNLPQLVLGVAFSWGILMAFTAETNEIPQAAYLLFVANALWTIAYDTQYAMVDREFDIKIGVKSTAILFGDADRLIIGMLQAMFIIALWLAARQFQMGLVFYLSLLVASLLLGYQQYLIRHRLPGPCFKAFINNNWVGASIFVGTFLNYL
jgi:4-hydroxybenzoate polyprenyltransferase